MKNTNLLFLLIALIGLSCNSMVHKIFDGHKTPHEQYAERLKDKDIDDRPEGREWLAASRRALEDPQTIALPYRQNGYFQSDKPRSIGLQFHAKQGERLTFTLGKMLSSAFVLYADLFRANSLDAAPVFSADTGASQFSFDIEESGDYILRLQPDLFRTAAYRLSISIGPSIGFPVSYSKANIGSYWGDDRDGGKRSHEGVDIFAPKRTPAIAAADGYITGVREGGLGGKTIWLRPEGKSYTLYYAHLDQQLVREGQTVKKGDTVGLVGNTGNAKYTPSHLHFGVYTYGGAVDPLPFVDRRIKTAPQVPAKDLSSSLQLIHPKKAGDSLIKAKTVLVPLAVTSKAYIAQLPNGRMIQVPFADVKLIKKEVRPANGLATKSFSSKGT